MRLSIVIPVYNVEKYISKCLESILDQGLDDKEYEIIIVNDGSTDRSSKIAQSFAQIHHHINVINKKNGGVGSARNLGMSYAKGTYIYFIDPDDYLISNCLNKLVALCESHTLDILTFRSKSFASWSIEDELISKNDTIDFSFDPTLISPILSGEDYETNLKYRIEVWSYLINREFLVETSIKFMEGRYLEDVVFSLDLMLRAKRIAHLPLVIHKYRISSESAMQNKKPSHYLKIIRDMQYAVLRLNPIIETLKTRDTNIDCIHRIKIRQQSIVFFSMIRMLRSTMGFDEVKQIMNDLTGVQAYPLNSFMLKDHTGLHNQVLIQLLKTRRRFFLCFRLLNPIFKLRYTVLKPILSA